MFSNIDFFYSLFFKHIPISKIVSQLFFHMVKTHR